MWTAFQSRSCKTEADNLMRVVDVNVSKLLNARIASLKVANNARSGSYYVQHSDARTERLKSARQ